MLNNFEASMITLLVYIFSAHEVVHRDSKEITMTNLNVNINMHKANKGISTKLLDLLGILTIFVSQISHYHLKI